MTEQDLIQRIHQGIGFKNDGTYTTDEDLISHMSSIVRDALGLAAKHKDQLERMIHKYKELRGNQALYFSGHKDKLSICKDQERDLDKKANALLTMGYNIDRFLTAPPTQPKLL